MSGGEKTHIIYLWKQLQSFSTLWFNKINIPDINTTDNFARLCFAGLRNELNALKVPLLVLESNTLIEGL